MVDDEVEGWLPSLCEALSFPPSLILDVLGSLNQLQSFVLHCLLCWVFVDSIMENPW
jgi:hypothetical protein